MLPYLDSLVKDLSLYEGDIAVIWNKLGKEHSLYKQLYFKHIELKEKNSKSVSYLQENFVLDSEDVASFQKFENKLYELRVEESSLNDQFVSVSKKYKGYLETNLPHLCKFIRIYKAEETNKIGELKDKIFINLLMYNAKSISHVGDLVVCYDTVGRDEQILSEVRQIFLSNLKKFDLPEGYIKRIIEKPILTSSPSKRRRKSSIDDTGNLVLESDSDKLDKEKVNEEDDLIYPAVLLNQKDVTITKNFKLDCLNEVYNLINSSFNRKNL